jgi:FKBP-type peptidyl-prolyl cis-trans isomerase FkpA
MRKGELGTTWVIFAALAVATLVAIPAAVFGEQPMKVPPGAKEVKTESGLRYVDIKVGDGAEAKTGSLVMVNYRAWLADGKEFDSSYARREPYKFKVGAHEVITGWDEGMIGMRVGGVRKLIIPPELGYGAQGAGERIPPNSTLIFEVHLLEVK